MSSILWADHWNQPYERELSDDEYAALKREFRGGGQSWFGDLGQAKKAVMDSFAARGYSGREFELYDRIVSREASMTLHTTVAGISRSTRGSAIVEDDYFPSYGFSSNVTENDMKWTLLTAPACFGTVAHVVFTEFGIDIKELGAVAQAAQHAALRLTPSKRRALSRNDSCWCGSGVKLKNCHGV